MTWEVNLTEVARDVDVAADAAGGKPEMVELTGGSLPEGINTSSPSTAVSRGGSFRGGESILPANSSRSSSNSNSSNNSTSSPIIEDDDGDTSHGDTVENAARGYAKRSAELPKGEANRLKSWGWRGETLASSRLRGMRDTIDRRLEAGSDARALLAEEDARQEQEKAEMGLGGDDYDELMDSLASRPAGFDMQDSAYSLLTNEQCERHA